MLTRPMIREPFLIVSSLLAVILSAGCRATIQDVVTYGGQLPRPEIVLVHDFTS